MRASQEFVLSYPSTAMAHAALFHGTHSGRDMDKLAVCGTRVQSATKIDSVLLCDAVANLECELQGELEAGDHVIFLGRAVAWHVNTDPGMKWLYGIGPGYKMGSAEARPLLLCREGARHSPQLGWGQHVARASAAAHRSARGQLAAGLYVR